MEKEINLAITDEPFAPFVAAVNRVMSISMGANEKQELEGFKLVAAMDFSLRRVSLDDEISPSGEARVTIVPNVTFKVTSTLQRKIQAKGTLPNNYELALDESIGAVRLRKIDDGQTSLFDEDRGMTYHVDAIGSVTIDEDSDGQDD